jgi:hypothetical protein
MNSYPVHPESVFRRSCRTALKPDAFVGFSSAEVERVFEALHPAVVGAIRPTFGACLHCRPCASKKAQREPDHEGVGPEIGHQTWVD